MSNIDDSIKGIKKLEEKSADAGVKICTISGKPPDPTYDGGAPQPIDEKTGMHKDYYILCEEERAKGFVRPVRKTYVHETCGVATTMSLPLAETYARDPKFYGATFCVGCRTHHPVGQFKWDDGTILGS